MVSNGKKTLESMNLNDMVHLFNRSIKNMLYNFIPHEIITRDNYISNPFRVYLAKILFSFIKKIMDLSSCSKTYWSVLTSFLNNIKIPGIP